MFGLSFIKSRAFIGIIVILAFMAFTYKVYDVGYDAAISEASLEAYEAERKHNEEVDKLEKYFAEVEREYLEREAKNKKEFKKKYDSAIKRVSGYVKDNGYSNCNIGSDGVREVNDLLRGETSSNK